MGHFGDGVYTSQKGPAEFGSQDAILKNNYTNKTDPADQERQIKDWRAKGVSKFCVPIIVPRRYAVNVKKEKTKEMQLVGHTARHGEPVRIDRDIWVIVIPDQLGEAKHAVEDFDAIYRHITSQDFSVRLDAVERLA